MGKKAIQTANAPAAIGPYSQAIQTAGGLIFVSGQIPLDPATGQLVTGGIEAETRQVMKNLEGVLSAAGSSFAKVVRSTIFLKDMGDFARVNEIYASFMSQPYPARATVQVARLPRDVSVEIDVIAEA